MSPNHKAGKFSVKNRSPKKRNQSARNSKPAAAFELQRQQICDAAARIIHEDGIRDYQKAKLRACDALQISSKGFLPTNEEIEHAVHRRIALFDCGYHQVIAEKQLATARDILSILSSYQPRVTQALATSLKLKHCPLEIHAFCDSAELVYHELQWRGIAGFMVEKRYRYSNSQYANVPLIVCQLDNCDIEISVFNEKELHRAPVCPTNGRTYERISLKQLDQKNFLQ